MIGEWVARGVELLLGGIGEHDSHKGMSIADQCEGDNRTPGM